MMPGDDVLMMPVARRIEMFTRYLSLIKVTVRNDHVRVSLTLRGFINYEFAEEHFESFLRTVTPGIIAGSIKYREDITRGLESAPEAFIGMLRGENFGKALIDLAVA
jgi:NADPH-dependent curcumin reductase CurA